MKNALILTTLSIAAAAMIVGCSSNDSCDSAEVTRTFVDTDVIGLGYRCGTSSEIKYTNPKFTCNEGDEVEFSIGSVILGTVKAASNLAEDVSPYNLAENNGEINNTLAVNIAQLIQSCDDDGNITEVIKIGDKAEAFEDTNISIGSSTFDVDANNTLQDANSTFTLVSNADAEAHLLNNAPDIVPPVITLNGSATEEIREGNKYTDPGATAMDNKDGNLTSAIKVTGSVDTSIVGENILTYAVVDKAGNEASKTRVVNVVANAAPVVTLLGNNPDTVRQNDTYVDPGATATDDLDGNVTANITVTGNVDTSVAKDYELVYSVTDSEGKTGSATRTVTVVEDKAPVVTLKGDNPLTRYDSDGAYTDPGATATDDFTPEADVIATLTPTDNVIPDVAGSYTYIWTATDDAGQTGTATRTVTVVEDKAPVVTLNGNATMTCGRIGGTYTDAGATATDDKDGSLTPAESGTVDLSTDGTYVVTWTATDSAGQSAKADRTVSVSCQNVNPLTSECEDTADTAPCQ
jgi:hypothetical protein